MPSSSPFGLKQVKNGFSIIHRKIKSILPFLFTIASFAVADVTSTSGNIDFESTSMVMVIGKLV
jgi:hypothetical protein